GLFALDVGDVGQLHRAPSAGEVETLELVERGQWRADLDTQRLVALGDRAGRDRDAVGPEQLGQRGRLDAPLGHLGRLRRDHDLLAAGAGDLHVTDAFDGVELRDDGLVELLRQRLLVGLAAAAGP